MFNLRNRVRRLTSYVPRDVLAQHSMSAEAKRAFLESEAGTWPANETRRMQLAIEGVAVDRPEDDFQMRAHRIVVRKHIADHKAAGTWLGSPDAVSDPYVENVHDTVVKLYHEMHPTVLE